MFPFVIKTNCSIFQLAVLVSSHIFKQTYYAVLLQIDILSIVSLNLIVERKLLLHQKPGGEWQAHICSHDI